MKRIGLLFVIASAVAVLSSGSQAGDVPPSDWITLNADDAFSLQAPPGTKFVQQQGTDSYVGDFKNPGFYLEFDYGGYSNSLSEFAGDDRYTVAEILVDGLKARLVTGPGSGHERHSCSHMTAVFVENSYEALGSSALEMMGCTKDETQIAVIQSIFKSIKFKADHFSSTVQTAATAAAQAEMGKDLFSAASNGDLERVKALIADGADVNARTDEGATALMIASIKGHADIVFALIAAKADVNAKMGNGETAIIAASFTGLADIVQALIAARADVNAKMNGFFDGGITPLLAAARERHSDVVRALIGAKADLNAKLSGPGNGGKTALMISSEGGDMKTVSALIGAGADVNARSDDGGTALTGAAHDGYVEVVRALLAAGADVNAKTNYGDTALIQASQHEFPEVIQILLAAGADVNAKTDYGTTALKMAARMGNAKVVAILKSAGAKQ